MGKAIGNHLNSAKSIKQSTCGTSASAGGTITNIFDDLILEEMDLNDFNANDLLSKSPASFKLPVALNNCTINNLTININKI